MDLREKLQSALDRDLAAEAERELKMAIHWGCICAGLGSLLVEKGVCTDEELVAAIDRQRSHVEAAFRAKVDEVSAKEARDGN